MRVVCITVVLVGVVGVMSGVWIYLSGNRAAVLRNLLTYQEDKQQKVLRRLVLDNQLEGSVPSHFLREEGGQRGPLRVYFAEDAMGNGFYQVFARYLASGKPGSGRTYCFVFGDKGNCVFHDSVTLDSMFPGGGMLDWNGNGRLELLIDRFDEQHPGTGMLIIWALGEEALVPLFRMGYTWFSDNGSHITPYTETTRGRPHEIVLRERSGSEYRVIVTVEWSAEQEQFVADGIDSDKWEVLSPLVDQD